MRALLVFLLLALAPPGAAAEKVWRVGLLASSPPSSGLSSWQGEALSVLAENGYRVGKNLELVERYSEGQAARLPRLAEELGGMRLDAIVAITDASVAAVLAATQTTPIVMVGDDPVASGFVQSLAHPGGRVTGIAFRTIEGDAKRLELLKEAFPGARRFGYLGMSYQSGAKSTAMARAAARLDVELRMHWIDDPADPVAAFSAMREEGVAAAVISATQPFAAHASLLAASAANNRVPVICEWDYMARAGCAFGYGHDLRAAQRRLGEFVVRILKGAQPAELPVEQSDVWKLTVNLRTAKALGVKFSDNVLSLADEVIE